jgi:hypothetical protein
VRSHSLSLVQEAVQAVPAQRYGAQLVPFGSSTQLGPWPSQISPVTTFPLQLVTPHAVPALAIVRHAPCPSHRPSALQEPG